MIKLITSISDLPHVLAASVSDGEERFIAAKKCLPFAVTKHYASLARPEADDPIRRLFFPDPRELIPDPFAMDDPLGQNNYTAAPGLIHQYYDRALLLAANKCAGYCRHCFRRVWLGSAEALPDITQALAYLAAHREIRELLISGGEPLTLSNMALDQLLRQIRAVRPDILFRLCTRVPITEPSRMDSDTIALLAAFHPLRMSVHINHTRELSPPARHVLLSCVEASIPVRVQTVLMRGINDDSVQLAALFHDCFELGLTPYYLFQMDLAPGTAHFRLPLKRGLIIYNELKDLIDGLSLPAYALDLPGGGGKIRLHKNAITGERQTQAGPVYILKDNQGREWYYPAN